MIHDKATKQLILELEEILEQKKRTKKYVIAYIILGLIVTLPWLARFFTPEGKTIDGCEDYITEKLGDLWEVMPTEDETVLIEDAVFEYYGITDESLSEVPT